MRAEHELLLLCARVNVDARAREHIARITRGALDWDDFARAAHRHGIEPLVYQNLRALCPAAIPREVNARLGAICFDIARQNLLLARELIAIRDLLAANDISALAYKGPVLALAAYGNLALRPITDLDLLIRPRDVARARAVLDAAGFRATEHFNPPEERAHLNANCEWTLANERVMVDVHWRVMPKFFYFPFDLDRAWARRASIEIAGTPVDSLALEDTLLVLCVHGSKHSWHRLEWLVSIAELTRRHPEIRWEVVVARARATGVERMVLLGVALAHELLDAPIPDALRSKIAADRALPKLIAQTCARLFDERADEIFEGTFVDELHAQMYARMIWRARYYWHAIFTPTVSDVRAIRLPRALEFLYYGLRPLRVLARFAPKLMHRRFGA